MIARRGWLIIALAFTMGMATHCGYDRTQAAHGCRAVTVQALISKRAAELCTGELVGCSLSFEQIKAALAEQEAAKACK